MTKAYAIPKLKLEDVVLLAELDKDVRKSLGSFPTIFIAYTDSEVALCWIRNQKDTEDKLFCWEHTLCESEI